MGAGKTTFMLSKLAVPLMGRREFLMWHGMESCQWTYIEPSKIQLLLDPEFNYTVWNRKTEEKISLDDLPVQHSFCYELKDFYRKAKMHHLNVIYMDYDRWVEFFEFLNTRPDIKWISIFFDEIEKFTPANVEGDLWRRNLRFANALAEFRKNFISFYCAAQQYSDVDYRVTRKMMYKVYLQDAKPPRSSMVFQHVPHHLKYGEAIVEGSTFKKTTFTPLKKHLYLVMRIEKPL